MSHSLIHDHVGTTVPNDFDHIHAEQDSYVNSTADDETADVLSIIHALHALATKDRNLAARNTLHSIYKQIIATQLGQAMVEYLPRLIAMLLPSLALYRRGYT